MFNTVDVHFYSSAAFIRLWPEIQKSIMLQIAEYVPAEDETKVRTEISCMVLEI